MIKAHTLLAAANGNLGTFAPPSDAFSKDSTSGLNATSNLELFMSNVIGAMTLIAGIFFIFYFVMGGLNWVTAGGEQGKVTKARDQMVQAVIGLVVIVMAYGLIGLVGQFVGLHLLNPAEEFQKIIPDSATIDSSRAHDPINTSTVVTPASDNSQQRNGFFDNFRLGN
jgi:hypothetical protein